MAKIAELEKEGCEVRGKIVYSTEGKAVVMMTD